MSRKIRQIRVEGNIAYVPLTRGYEAIIDTADVPLVEGRNWCADSRGHNLYARSSQSSNYVNVKTYMHRLIMGAELGESVDHISGDGLDNRRGNMRLVSHAENLRNQRVRVNNTSGLKGVSWNKRAGKWVANIRVDGKSQYLGLFICPVEAHAAYCEASERLHGEFGRTE